MVKSAAPDQIIGAVRYTVRKGAGATVRIQKWEAGEGKRASYFVSPQGWFQRCSCAARTVCKHIRLINLIDSGRLGTGPYVWDGMTWRVVEPRGDGLNVPPSKPSLQSGRSNNASVHDGPDQSQASARNQNV